MNLRGADVVFFASFENEESIFPQLAVLYALPRFNIASLRVVLPFFPTGTMERAQRQGEIITAKTLARLLSGIPLSKGGPAEIIMFDVHDTRIGMYFSDEVIPRLESAMDLVEVQINRFQPRKERVSIVFPDEGAWKRFGAQFEKYPQIICSKVRSGDKRQVRIADGNPKSSYCIIVDDQIQTGGTILECQKALQAAGATKVSAFATHAVFPQDAHQNFFGAGFDHIWVTDSCPSAVPKLCGDTEFTVIPIEMTSKSFGSGWRYPIAARFS